MNTKKKYIVVHDTFLSIICSIIFFIISILYLIFVVKYMKTGEGNTELYSNLMTIGWIINWIGTNDVKNLYEDMINEIIEDEENKNG